MPTQPTQISVDVSIDKEGVVTYKSSNAGVAENGDILINVGEMAVITFEPASGEQWSFVSPWIEIVPTGSDVSFVSGQAQAVAIQDNNPAVGAASSYAYCLRTTTGPLDPRLINKGT